MCDNFELTLEIDREDMGEHVARYLFAELIWHKFYILEEDPTGPSKKEIKKIIKAFDLLLTNFWPELYDQMIEDHNRNA